MTISYATVTAGTLCRDCTHFAAFRGERDGWEAALGACRHWHNRVQHAQSQPHRFGCGAWTPAAGPTAASQR